ncbi:MAG: TraY domain [Alphaproteobacteria bacterium]|nr:TraY domain [Alphaproteobacteria bacterium]
MLSIRLPKETEDRLSALSARTHRSKSYFIKAALERYLEDEEDYSILISAACDQLSSFGLQMAVFCASVSQILSMYSAIRFSKPTILATQSFN